MIVYAVLERYDHEGDTLLLVTADENKAIEEAKKHVQPSYQHHVFIEKWDAVKSERDSSYEKEFWQ